MQNPTLSEAYRSRRIRFIERWELDGWQLKVYGIAHADRPWPSREVLGAASAYTRQQLAAARNTPDHYGVGFVIAHAGREGTFLLIDWWAGENMLYQSVGFAAGAGGADFMAAPAHLVACVWELAVLGFEREAWLATALNNASGPDLDAYLEQQFNADL